MFVNKSIFIVVRIIMLEIVCVYINIIFVIVKDIFIGFEIFLVGVVNFFFWWLILINFYWNKGRGNKKKIWILCKIKIVYFLYFVVIEFY